MFEDAASGIKKTNIKHAEKENIKNYYPLGTISLMYRRKFD